MKFKKVLAAVFALIGVCTATTAVCLSLSSMDASPVLLTPPEEAQQRVVDLMDAVCEADYEKVSAQLAGNPALGVDREPADEVGGLIWDAFTESLSYELAGECYATNDGLAQNVVLTCMDMSTVTASLRDRSQALLEERVQNAEDASEIYDDNNDYREDFVMDVLFDAAVQALEQDAGEMTVELTLKLTYQDGQWWVTADSELLDAVSGGILY